MKKTLIILFAAILCFQLAGRGQSVKTLPYSTGFDSFIQQVGWANYRTKGNSNYQWEFVSFAKAQSSPNSAFHDYPVGNTMTDTVIDWLVSPPFKVLTGARLKFSFNGFMYQAASADYFGIWASTTNSNPSAGGYTEIADLTSAAGKTTSWHDTTINIPFTGNSVYIAFKYRETNNWYTINLDDISVSEKSAITGISAPKSAESLSLEISPSIFSGTSTLFYSAPASGNVSMRLWDRAGQLVKETVLAPGKGQHLLDLSGMPAGVYFCQVLSGEACSDTRKIVLLK